MRAPSHFSSPVLRIFISIIHIIKRAELHILFYIIVAVLSLRISTQFMVVRCTASYLACIYIYIHSVCCCSFVCSLARSLAHTSLYICLHVYCNKRAASECVRTFWQTLNLRQIFFYSYK